MKTGKTHLPKELEFMLDESRPELIEVDSSLALPPMNRGQVSKKFSCPHTSYCNVKKFGKINCMNENTIKSCQTYKFYNRYGEDWNQCFI